MIRVLVADDHEIVRDGLKRILTASGDLQVAGEAANGDEALALARANDYDVALLDMSMPGLSGIDLVKRLKAEKPKMRLLVLSMHGEPQYAARALKAGASGYLTKDSASTQLATARRSKALIRSDPMHLETARGSPSRARPPASRPRRATLDASCRPRRSRPSTTAAAPPALAR